MFVLAVGAVVASGGYNCPLHWGGWTLFTDFLQPVLPLPATRAGGFAGSAAASVIVALVSLAGIYLAYLFFGRRPALWRASGRAARLPAARGVRPGRLGLRPPLRRWRSSGRSCGWPAAARTT